MKKEGFVKGAVLGGLIGSAAGLLLAPKAGKDLRCDIADTYCNFNEKGHHLKDALSEKGHHLKDAIQGGAEDLHDTFFDEENGDNSEFVIGSVVGALIGASVAVFLAPKSGKDLRRDLEKTYEKVKDTAGDYRDEAVDYVHKGQKAARNSIEGAKSSVDDFMELAQMGLKIWNNLQNRR